MGINNVGRTVTPMTAAVNVDSANAEDEGSLIRIDVTLAQARKLAEMLHLCVDDDTVRLDWNEPETADFRKAFVDAVRDEIGLGVL